MYGRYKQKKLNSTVTVVVTLNKAPIASIVMFENAEFPVLYPEFVKYLKSNYGTSGVFIAKTRTNAAIYKEKYGDVFDETLVLNDPSSFFLNNRTQELDNSRNVTERALSLERILGQTINSLRVADRHLGRGFQSGGTGHPRVRFHSKLTDERVLAAYVMSLEALCKLLQVREVSLVFDAPPWGEALLRSLGIEYRKLLPARYKNFNYWLDTYTGECKPLKICLKNLLLNDQPLAGFKLPEKQYNIALKRDVEFNNDISLVKTLAYSARRFLRFFYGVFRDLESAQGYTPWSDTAYLLRRWFDARLFSRKKTTPLSQLKDRRFVLFPLQVEPELSLHGFSPEFFCQQTALSWVAQELPADVSLVIKEHKFVLGRRPRKFYEEINELGNVIWADLYEAGIDWVTEADAVVTISSSAGIEAAMLGTPVVTFGQHNMYLDLPHIYLCHSANDLKIAMRDALKNTDSRSENLLAGKKLAKAIEISCINMNNYNKNDPESFGPNLLANIADNLLNSFNKTSEDSH